MKYMNVGGSYYEIDGKSYPFDEITGEVIVNGKRVKLEDFIKRRSKDVNEKDSSVSKG